MDLLFPFKWIISLVLVGWHSLFSLFLDPDAGITWVLAIMGVTVVVRAALIPIFVKQIKSQRNMLAAQPELAKLQKKYKGKTDRDSREKMAKEQMEIYKRTGSNPLSSCLPLLIQMPIFSALFFTVSDAQKDHVVGLLDTKLAQSLSHASLFDAPLKETFFGALGHIQGSSKEALIDGANYTNVLVIAAIMIVTMTVSQFITQKQILAKNQNPEVQNSQYMQTQKIMLWILPIVFLISGTSFAIGIMFYWLASNIWTMGQQYVVIRNMPTPGSIAHKQREERLAAKGKLPKKDAPAIEEAVETPRQRVQPVGKSRAKKTTKN
ncbi:MAG: membrane protein insertase YidC [Actinomycetales bacterium]|nr:membrane protein insertase YidC [Actinomycetales bacterium]